MVQVDANSESMSDEKIKDILLQENIVSPTDVAKAEEFRLSHDTSFIDFFVTEGIVTHDVIGQTVANSLGVPYADLHSNPPSRHVLMQLPAELALQFRAVAYSAQKKRITIATDNPLNGNLAEALVEAMPDKEIHLAFALPADVTELLSHYGRSFSTRFADLLEQEHPAPEVVNKFIIDALISKASDLHFEPQPEGTDALLRMRIDGVLHDAGNIPVTYYENILNRLKVETKLNIEDSQSIQDGAFRFEYDDRTIDIRISVVPTINGETINLHFLTEHEPYTLSNIGLSAEDREIVLRSIQKPYGLIMVTGPTGAGKTTTAYSMLKLVNKPERHVMTIEDPVEYTLPGVSQIQVNQHANLTFATGLKSILRQDPDSLLIGEILEKETAAIAINAALTGHLVLTTFHAVDAATAIPRLIEMEIEPFILASTLEIIVSQRLVRRICQNCIKPVDIKLDTLAKDIPNLYDYFQDESTPVYRGAGCEQCNHTGYRGRVGVFEIVHMNQEMQNLILTRPNTQAIWDLARQQRLHTMLQDGLNKVQRGITTIDEIVRVIPIHE